MQVEHADLLHLLSEIAARYLVARAKQTCLSWLSHHLQSSSITHRVIASLSLSLSAVFGLLRPPSLPPAISTRRIRRRRRHLSAGDNEEEEEERRRRSGAAKSLWCRRRRAARGESPQRSRRRPRSRGSSTSRRSSGPFEICCEPLRRGGIGEGQSIKGKTRTGESLRRKNVAFVLCCMPSAAGIKVLLARNVCWRPD